MKRKIIKHKPATDPLMRRGCSGYYRCSEEGLYEIIIQGHSFFACRKHKNEETFGGVGHFKTWLKWVKKYRKLEKRGLIRRPRTMMNRNVASRQIKEAVRNRLEEMKKKELKAHYREWLEVNDMKESPQSFDRFVAYLEN